jgi:DnaJ homolog subfamily B member 4
MPFSATMGPMGGMPAGFGGPEGFPREGRPAKRSEPIQYNFYVSLEDLYQGSTKRMRITKKIWDAQSQGPVQVKVEKEIPVK